VILIKPISIENGALTGSTVPEPDAGETVWTAGTYNKGDRRISTVTHRVYEVVADPTTHEDPVNGVDSNPPTWVDVGPTNRWAMFDTVNSTQTSESTQLIVELDTGLLVNSIAGFSIEGATSINVTMDDPTEGEVYNNDLEMIDNSEVTDFYYYYFSPIVQISSFALLDLPAYSNATLTLTVNGNNILFGNLVLGNQVPLGIANYGTSVQLLDFSRKETDIFGNTVVTKGRTSKRVTYDVTIQKSKVNYVFDTIASVTTTPAVWIGDDASNDPTLVFGYYKDFQNNISSPTITDATITIEGLV